MFPLHPFQSVALLCGPRLSCLACRTEGKLFANCLFFFLRRNHFRQPLGIWRPFFLGHHFQAAAACGPLSGSSDRFTPVCVEQAPVIAEEMAKQPKKWVRQPKRWGSIFICQEISGGSLKNIFLAPLKHGFVHQNKGKPRYTRQCSGVFHVRIPACESHDMGSSSSSSSESTSC